MLRYIKTVLRYIKSKELNDDNTPLSSSELSLSSNLHKNLNRLREIFGISSDIVIREFTFGRKHPTDAALIFVDGLADKATINQSIIKPLMYDIHFIGSKAASPVSIDHIRTTLLSVGEVKSVSLMDDLVDDCMSGDTILLIDGLDQALVLNVRAWENRGVQEPQSEVGVRGPREGFSETFRINTSLLRRKIQNPDLIIETMEIGRKAKTCVGIAYLKGVVNPALIDEIKSRLNRINTDAILESGYIEQYIEDAPFSIFPTVSNSEKPDIVAAKLLEGRAALLIDGTPVVLTVPMVFIESFQTADDYYLRFWFAGLIRTIRFTAFLATILTPAVYVAVLAFHRELIPTPLLFTLAAAQEGLPFPVFLEVAFMLITFDILREAGIRLPRPIGQAISIVGALIIGDVTVAAGLVSYFSVIVIALTAVSSFVVDAQIESANILRYILFLLSGFIGGFGILIGLIGTMIHLSTLRSFGIPYLSPLTPVVTRDLKDTFVRAPLWAMGTRPEGFGPQDLTRQAGGLKPSASQEEDNL